MSGNILVDPVNFMSNNLVLPSGSLGGDQSSSGIQTMCLVPNPTGTAKQHGHGLGHYFVTKYKRQSNAEAVFEAYWCPYSQNNTLKCVIGTEARLCFTAAMDGCSFGFVSRGGGSGVVAHANEGTYGAHMGQTYGSLGQEMMQADEQANRLKHILGSDPQIIAPNDYMKDHDGVRCLKSTTFGIRDGSNWHFYTQEYLRRGTTYFLRSVKKQF